MKSELKELKTNEAGEQPLTANELIALFLGWKPCQCDTPKKLHYKYGDKNWEVVEFDKMKFDTDWNWLMPAVHKILKSTEPLPGKGWSYEYIQLETARVGNSIDYIYMKVVEFIKRDNSERGVSF